MPIANSAKLQKEIDVMIQHIIRELIVEFGKSETEAIHLVEQSDVKKSLMQDPSGFHDSPYHWALSILTDCDEAEALERHLYHH
ncbi:hypothetical protein SAMN05192569_102333 [Parageobacillus thermantarcticus]|uniref:Uncharacterized protein n=1 Tax=Parageobacillus thermantarcticus TaxID=186116 RepID=A0A1I0TDZ5_9BACL|nr:hypothetical protein [Parageobacillus thermantarcticus]SFA49959.1 hypothetical protein SAMN05192569_102333 [Parageobacillus thermantarcticus]